MAISDSVELGNGVNIFHPDLVNLYGCSIGDDSKIGTFAEVQKGAAIGARCKISSHSFICEGVMIDDEVFIGHGVMFTNDSWPRSTNSDGSVQDDSDWQVLETRVGKGASIGSGSTVLPGLTIGENAMIGAGTVVTKNVPDFAIVVGNPARIVGDVREREQK